ncbi:glycoside hydrolase family 26 protein [Thalassotalea agarivorans]|nr:hypothetical protein [Thalassotalea agarivorans]
MLTACNSSQERVNSDEATLVGEDSTSFISTRFVPPQNKQLLFIGQDSDTIRDYIAAVPEDNIEAVTLYSQLKHSDPNQTLKGIHESASWNSGEVSFPKTLAASPQAAIAIGLALDTCNGQANHTENVAQGNYDASLAQLVTTLKSWAPRKVFLRIGYEFDGPWNCYQPDSYKAAFRHIKQAIDNNGATNIATVWQSATWPDGYGNKDYDVREKDHFEKWYPGDDVVDWVSMSVFYRDLSNWNYVPPSTPDFGQQKMLAFARAHNKPLMISEAAPQGYRTEALTQSVIQENKPSPVSAEQIWLQWYQPFFDFIEQNKDVIRAVAYINTQWEAQGMWICEPNIAAGQQGCNNGNWGDSRVQANEYIKSKWLEQINDESTWIQTSQYE